MEAAMSGIAREIELARMDVANAEADLARAEENLDNAQVRSRIGGIVAYVDIWKGVEKSLSPLQIGERRNNGSDLCKVADTSNLQVKLLINERDLPGVKIGQDAEIYLPAYPERSFRGKVSTISPVAGDKNVLLGGLMLARWGQSFIQASQISVSFADVGEEDFRNMRLGLSAIVKIRIGRAEGLIAPATALRGVRWVGSDMLAVVLKAAEGGEERPVEVRVNGWNGSHAAIEPIQPGSIAEGDRIVADAE